VSVFYFVCHEFMRDNLPVFSHRAASPRCSFSRCGDLFKDSAGRRLADEGNKVAAGLNPAAPATPVFV
jgi:hypothetical protein